MPKYKVGDVAALFPKPSAPKSDTGKKIQSMFDEFYKNSKKLKKPNHSQFEQKKKQTNNKETYSESPREAKKKKRKYSDNDDTESNAQGIVQPQTKQKKAKLDSTHQNLNGKTAQEENYFPRNKKKSKHFNSVEENSSAFSKMHFDDDEEESFSHVNSEEQKVSDKKKKKKNKLSETEVAENNDHDKFKNKSSKKMKTFVNSRNQSNDFNVTDTSAFDKPMEEKQSPEKKSKKKKNKKQKKDKIVQNEAIAQEVHSGTEDIDVQNDDEEPKIKQKSKKLKKSLPLEKSLKQKSETEEKDESTKANLSKKKLQKKPLETAERLSRTLFVGNLPVRMTRHALQKLFAPFGSIEACRLRGSVPVKATIPKKIAAIKSEFHAGQKSCIGYVVFKDAKDATEALTLNGDLVGDHHIIVNPASSTGEKKTYDEKRSIFIGNLPFDVEDEAIWSSFAACGEVEAVRAIRDPETGAGKGFGYVLFKNIDSKEAALKMEGIEISKRKIRIKEVKSNIRKSVPSSNNKLNAMRRKAKKLKNKQDGPNSRKSLKKLMNREKRNYQKKKIASIFKKFST